MVRSHQTNRISRNVAVGAVTVLVGVVLAIVFALQPWRICPEDDVPAGCAALPQDVLGMMLGMCIILGGAAALVVGSLRRGKDV
ncbi:hypothetical protein [Microbacterium sp. Yaish 1]|uniref:hypothetical protein n=1 Tax=Microbacterium sp. Yaish 1 TaxID=2025014 RepID=UPI00117D0242|nr:hypothetical protein [Microbacterium sp. Yaish 1]